ncbi:MAG TPA: hypothetical protein VH230_13030 [Stellaceae bacterium]|nr:hypothetical protein [Stellaceae bacterium]
MERRAFLLSSMMLALTAGRGEASPIDPAQTFVLQRDQIKFAPWGSLPPGSGEIASRTSPVRQRRRRFFAHLDCASF